MRLTGEVGEASASSPRLTSRSNDAGIGERGELVAIAISRSRAGKDIRGGGMRIDLGQAIRQMSQQTGQAIRRHGSSPGEAEHLIGGRETRAPHAGIQHPRERRGYSRLEASLDRLNLLQHVDGFDGRADGGDAEAPAKTNNFARDRWVHVKVLVGVDVVEREPCRPESLELGLDFGCELPPHRG